MILNELTYPKEVFNPTNKRHCDVFAQFLKNSAWGHTGCPFVLEEPYISVPDMIKDKIVRDLLGVKNEGSN